MEIKKMLKDMFEEKDDFYKYVELAKESEEKYKQTFWELAKQEKGHYKMIYDMIFCPEMKMTDELGQAIKDYAAAEFCKMEEVKM